MLTYISRLYAVFSVLLVFLGPYFFYFTIHFLRKQDYTAAILTLLAGGFLLRAGVDLARTLLVTVFSGEQEDKPKS